MMRLFKDRDLSLRAFEPLCGLAWIDSLPVTRNMLRTRAPSLQPHEVLAQRARLSTFYGSIVASSTRKGSCSRGLFVTSRDCVVQFGFKAKLGLTVVGPPWRLTQHWPICFFLASLPR